MVYIYVSIMYYEYTHTHMCFCLAVYMKFSHYMCNGKCPVFKVLAFYEDA